MGTIRLMLALAVVLAHLHEQAILPTVSSRVAVQAFFIISGFYMAVILNEKYTGPGSYRLFISNRFLRLYPVYYVVLLGTVLVSAASGLLTGDALGLQAWRDYASTSDRIGLWFLGISHVTVIGQDVALFLGRTPEGAFHFTRNFALSDPLVFKFLLVPQTWALSLELSFYLVAPLLVCRSLGWLALFAGLSFALKIYLFEACHLHFDPWTYRFFPTELGLFLVGACAYRAHQMYRSRLPTSRVTLGAWLTVLALTLGLGKLPDLTIRAYSFRTIGYLSVVALLLPLVFQCSRNWKLDRMVGELSFPLYLCHLAIIWVADKALPGTAFSDAWRTAIVLSASLACAYGIVRRIMLPIERIRQQRLLRYSAGLG